MAAVLSREEAADGEGFDLVGLYAAAGRVAIGQSEVFREYGLPPTTAARLQVAAHGQEALAGLGRQWPYTAERVPGVLTVKGDGFVWWQDPEGAPAVIQPVLMKPARGLSGLVDLIAWNPARPAKWRFLTRAATHLGDLPGERIFDERTGPLRLVATPLAWLADPDAVCLLSYADEVIGELALEREILCDSRDLAELVEERLRRRLPVVGVG
jgi:hypothetical protein